MRHLSFRHQREISDLTPAINKHHSVGIRPKPGPRFGHIVRDNEIQFLRNELAPGRLD